MANTAANKITYDSKPVQVESAIRDGTGLTINTTYVKKSTVSVPSTVPTLSWSGTATIGSVDGKDFKVTMPSNPNSDTKVTQTKSTDTTKFFPLLASATADLNTNSTTTSVFAADMKLNPGKLTFNKSTSYTSWYQGSGGSSGGYAWLNYTGTKGNFFPFLNYKSTNGHISIAGYQDKLYINYQTIANADTTNNQVTKKAILFTESGGASWDGTVTAGAFSGPLTGNVTGNCSGSAGKLSNTSKIGDTNQPVYFTANGVPAAISYTIAKSVPSDAAFTDVSCTAVGNHYAPSTDSSAALSASASGATAAWSIDVVKGVTLSRDAKGHVTGISVTSGKIPANPNTDTKVRQTLQTGNYNLPLLMSYQVNTNTDTNVDNVCYRNNNIYANTSTGILTANAFAGALRGGNNKQFSFGGISSFRITGNASTDPVQLNQTNNGYWRICSITKDQYIANNRSWHVKLRIVCVNTSNTRYTNDAHSTSVACNIAIRHDFVVEFNVSKTGGNTTILNDTDTGRGSGIYAIRTLMPKNDNYGPQVELYKWYSNTTTVDDNFKAAGTDCQVYVYVLEDDVGLTWENNANNKPTTSSYNSSNYNQTTLNVGQYNENYSSHKYNINIRGGCDGTAGWANGAWDRLDNDRYYYGETVVAGSLAALAPDGLMWHLRNTNKTFSLPLHFGRCTGTFAAGANYGRVMRTARGLAYSEFTNATMQGTAFTVPTLASTSTSSTDYGKQLYMRGALVNGNFKPDGTITFSMEAGYTWIPIGKIDYTNVGIATAPSTWTLDGYNANAYTLDSNGKLTHINGKEIYTNSGGLNCTVDGVTGTTVTRYAVCSTDAYTSEKTASVTNGSFALETGARVTVKFSNLNYASDPKLNINSTGAKYIYHNGARIASGTNKGMLYGACDFVYDGTNWLLIGNYTVNNGTLTIKDGLGNSLGTFTANQSTNKTITLPNGTLQVQNVSVSFSPDSTYSSYPYRASITVAGATVNSFADVVFSEAQIKSGLFAPFCVTGTNVVYIYARSNPGTQVIPTVSVGFDNSALTVDATPTSGSTNAVTSGGVYSALNPVQSTVSNSYGTITMTTMGKLTILHLYNMNLAANFNIVLATGLPPARVEADFAITFDDGSGVGCAWVATDGRLIANTRNSGRYFGTITYMST